jgi:hypothetical protein
MGKGAARFVTSPGPKQPRLQSAAACQISFAAALGPWLTTVEELRIWPINCHIPLLLRKNAAGCEGVDIRKRYWIGLQALFSALTVRMCVAELLPLGHQRR